MKTLEQIKNDYAVTQHYGCWNELLLNNDSFTVGNLHLNNVMKIYAMECLKRAMYNSSLHGYDDEIINENNIIK